MSVRFSLHREQPPRIVDPEIGEPTSHHAIVLYEEDDAGNVVVNEAVDRDSPAHRPIKMDAREALLALHDIAVGAGDPIAK